MGNTPTQQPYEGDPPNAEDSADGTSLRESVVGFVRDTLAGVRRRLSVFPSLELGSAFSVTEAEVAGSRRLRSPDPDAESSEAAASLATVPDRELPLVQPARDTGRENAPDLEATEEDGRLAIYYPERSGARISSDTWETVEP